MLDKRMTYGRNGIASIFSDLLVERQVSRVSQFLNEQSGSWDCKDYFRLFLSPKFTFNDLFSEIKEKLGGELILPDSARFLHLDEDRHTFSEISYSVKSLYGVLHCSLYTHLKQDGEHYKQSLVKILDKYLLNGDTFVPIRWFYLSYGDVCHSDIVEVIDEHFYQAAYPYIKDLDEYIDDYLDSNETILLLKGGVGTGKTRFIRHLVYRMLQRSKIKASTPNVDDYAIVTSHTDFEDTNGTKVMYTSDPEVFKTDEVFITYMEGQNQVLVLEDMDTLLQSRTQGNTFVNRLLAASDGFISSVQNKMIISTNLSSVERDIDSALLRPGRCFDVLEFRALEYEEVLELVSKLGLPVDEFEKLVGSDKKDKYTLAEVYRIVNQKRVSGYKKKVFGFTK